MKNLYIMLMFILGVTGVTLFLKAVTADYNRYLQSSECIAKHTNKGTPRDHIKVVGSSCELKPFKGYEVNK